MRRLYEAFERRDFDTVRAAIHPDFVMHQTELLPWGGTHRGPDGYFAFLGTLFSHIETTVQIEEMYDSGDHVHPNDAGHASLAEAVDLESFS